MFIKRYVLTNFIVFLVVNRFVKSTYDLTKFQMRSLNSTRSIKKEKNLKNIVLYSNIINLFHI